MRPHPVGATLHGIYVNDAFSIDCDRERGPKKTTARPIAESETKIGLLA
jgi:hypothetical protein